MGVGRRSGPRSPSSARVHNTAQARWSEFGTVMDAILSERPLKSVGSCDQLYEFVRTYLLFVVSLDMKDAFDKVWWPALKTQLLAYKCSINLNGMVRGYLRDREVFADDVVLMFSGLSGSSVEEDAHLYCWGVKNRLSFSDHGDVESEFGDREDHIHCRDRANNTARFVSLGTSDREARHVEDVRRCPVVREAAWWYKVKRGKEMEDIFVDRELGKPLYSGELPHPAHVAEIGFESVEELDSQILNRLAVVGPHIYTDAQCE
ncbi:hypothetical protein EVAR_19239_1 [Eumeta japonica]|uniref:Reverse transcriptase domain-containing protein n=1 Tax=Eumeta variegata TaxID=151549 RepID=A0A4C1VEX8_EUMVA|nr:hypothetical protein EVAR_19239_1 [Eumeta japonica]